MVRFIQRQYNNIPHWHAHFRRTAGCHECLLVPLSWLVEYVEAIQAVSGVWLHKAASKMLTNCLSGEHGEQQGVLINNAELSAYRTPGLALSNICNTMIDRVWNLHTIRPCHTNSDYIFKSAIAYTILFIVTVYTCIFICVSGYIQIAGKLVQCFSSLSACERSVFI